MVLGPGGWPAHTLLEISCVATNDNCIATGRRGPHETKQLLLPELCISPTEADGESRLCLLLLCLKKAEQTPNVRFLGIMCYGML